MSTSSLGSYYRTMITVAVVLLAMAFLFSSLRIDTWVALKPFFEWMGTTWFGVIGTTWGAAFAVVEAFHLLAMALMGGAIIVSDGRLLGIGFSEMDEREVLDKSHKIFSWGLAVVLLTGVFMACGVAMKIYYLEVYWYKMLALLVGILFAYFVKKPLLKKDLQDISPLVRRAVALSSLVVWFSVAGAGRWIGFSG
ncbi:MAG: DUF6644 family protein [Oceanicoccus sp.]